MSFPTIGKLAPAFSLLNQDGEKVQLKDFKGKSLVVLYFYPKAMTPGCTIQACGLRDSKKELTKLNTIAIGISPDLPSKLLKFIDKEDLNFELLSDPEHEIAEKYGVWGKKKFMGKEYIGIIRTTFIIGTDGKLKTVLDDFTTKNHHQEVIDYIKEHLA